MNPLALSAPIAITYTRLGGSWISKSGWPIHDDVFDVKGQNVDIVATKDGAEIRRGPAKVSVDKLFDVGASLSAELQLEQDSVVFIIALRYLFFHKPIELHPVNVSCPLSVGPAM